MTTATEKLKSAPVEKIRIGSVQASIWKQEGQDGPFYTCCLERSYKDSTGAWKTSSSYGSRDLINLAKASLAAHSAIVKLKGPQQSTEQEDSEAA